MAIKIAATGTVIPTAMAVVWDEEAGTALAEGEGVEPVVVAAAFPAVVVAELVAEVVEVVFEDVEDVEDEEEAALEVMLK
jgi:hypothetical protein